MLSCYRASLVTAFPGGQHSLVDTGKCGGSWELQLSPAQCVAFPVPHTELRREERKDTLWLFPPQKYCDTTFPRFAFYKPHGRLLVYTVAVTPHSCLGNTGALLSHLLYSMGSTVP